MSLNPQFVLMPALQQQIWDKTLDIPLEGGKVYFWEDANRSVAKNVYELTGSGPGSYTYTSLGAVLTLSGIGTFIDMSGANIIPYLYPYVGLPTDIPPSTVPDNYFIQVYSNTGVFQFDIQGWPNITGEASPINEANTTGNIISNSQFIEVLFNTSANSSAPIVISTTGTNTSTSIAPNWDMVTTGTGSFSVYQNPISDTAAVSNPPYALAISASSGYSSPLILRQRIFTPRIFSGSSVSGTFVAESLDGGLYALSMSYVPSGTGTPEVICSGTTPNTGFFTIANSSAVLITPPNTGAAPSAYVDITITIPVGASVQISSIQLAGVSSSSESVGYLQNTPEQEINGLFHYYKPQLDFKPLKSYLVGWDFALNPAQWGSSIVAQSVGANKSYYAWDQTILFQTANSGITVARESSADLMTLTAAATTQMAVIQYLSAAQAKSILYQVARGVSVNIALNTTATQNFTVSLWFSNNVVGTGMTSNNSLVTALDANGHPTVASGWTEITMGLLGTAMFKSTSTVTQNVGFSQFVNSSAYTAGVSFAIVLGTDSVVSGNTITLQSISVVPGAIPTIPAPQTFDEVLRDCQLYYEKSYDNATLPGTISVGIGSQYMAQTAVINSGSTQVNLYPQAFTLNYFTIKRSSSPTFQVYSVSSAGTAGSVQAVLYYNGSAVATGDKILSSFFTPADIGQKSISYIAANANTMGAASFGDITKPASGFIQFQYTVDARLGIV